MEVNTNISVNDAWHLVKSKLFVPETEVCSISKSFARILATDVFADRDFPPFNRVAMDGICIRHHDFICGTRDFELAGVQAAGTAQLNLPNGNLCLEVMTGAVLPQNSDTVIRYEDLTIIGGNAKINIEDVRSGQNVHTQGSDRKSGDCLIGKGKKISFAEIGVLATVGCREVEVLSMPKMVIISTGDELVDIEERPLPHQLRKSNVFALEAIGQQLGLKANLVHLSDDKKLMEETIAKILETYDVALFSGAVSKGKFDYLPEILQKLGVEKHFHGVQQRPGKPFWFGTKNSKAIFAFPGNPVSTMVCALRFFRPWLQESLGQQPENVQAVLMEDITFKPNLQYFLTVQLVQENGQFQAWPLPGNGSGDLANLVDANAFLELPSEEVLHKKGSMFPVLSW